MVGRIAGLATMHVSSPPFERSLYRPLRNVVKAITRRAGVIQSGNINQYIAYIFVIVIVVLILRAL